MLPENAVVLSPSHAREALHQCSRSSPENVDGTWIISPADIAKLENSLSKLSALVSRDCCIVGRSVSCPTSYFRQYAGITISGKKYIYINAFELGALASRSRNQPLLVCDGGESFWGALYDPESGEFSQLAFNGSA